MASACHSSASTSPTSPPRSPSHPPPTRGTTPAANLGRFYAFEKAHRLDHTSSVAGVHLVGRRLKAHGGAAGLVLLEEEEREGRTQPPRSPSLSASSTWSSKSTTSSSSHPRDLCIRVPAVLRSKELGQGSKQCRWFLRGCVLLVESCGEARRIGHHLTCAAVLLLFEVSCVLFVCQFKYLLKYEEYEPDRWDSLTRPKPDNWTQLSELDNWDPSD
ncbi:hypothetical protein VPH35_137398 [Triticum aestivum]|uniref:Uncharacterized protein n=1 Tax=Aegilops tauschii TaxID=37682 RepID=M8CJI1_AEGTA